jgi:RNA polymerase sigma factor (sigma-70 family)
LFLSFRTSGDAQLQALFSGRGYSEDVHSFLSTPTGVRMAVATSFVLGELLRTSNSDEREAAWEELISRHTRLLLAVARSFHGEHDEAMERYTYILGKLRESDFHRLRTFDPHAGASFSTWLAVAARRLCLDHHRSLYGRQRPTLATNRAEALRTLRRSLVDSLSAEIDTDLLPDSVALAADAQAAIAERDSLLAAELSRLTPRERLLLALRFQDGLSASRIAGILGLATQFNVYRQLNSVLTRLRTALTARGLDGVDG